MKTKLKFIKNFANKKAGQVWSCDSMLARTLIDAKVAKKYDEKKASKSKSVKAG